jgi:hypothetical protein
MQPVDRRRSGWRSSLRRLLFSSQRAAAVLVLEAALVAVAFHFGYLFRFEGHVPADRTAQFAH